MRLRLASLALLTLFVAAHPAAAGTVLDRVRAHKMITCGSVLRPGLAAADASGRFSASPIRSNSINMTRPSNMMRCATGLTTSIS